MAKLEKKCPHCRQISTGKREIKKNFGFRMMNGVEKPQSHCKKCRVAQAREIKQVKKMIKAHTVTVKST